MALFKILKGPEKKDDLGVSVMLDPNKSGLKINEGWAYVTEEGNFYVDFSKDQRLHINAHSITSDFATSDENGYEIAKTYISKIEYIKDENDIKGSSSNPYLRYHFGPQTGLAPVHVAMPAANASNGGIITTGTQIITGDKTINDGGSLTVTKPSGFTFSGIQKGDSNVARVVWFAHSSKKGTPVYNENFSYNPLADTWSIESVPSAEGMLYVSRLQGLAYAAEKDASNQTISSTYISNIALSNNKNAPTYNITKGDNTGFVVQFPVADASNSDNTKWTAGIVTNTNQTFGGDKTFKGSVSISSTEASSSSITGALKVSGGVGVAGNIYSGGSINAKQGAFSEDVGIGGNLTVAKDKSTTLNGTLSVGQGASIANGLVVSSGVITLSGETSIGAKLNVGGIVDISNVTDSNATDKGALIVAGGVGIGKALYVGGMSNLQGGLTVGTEKAFKSTILYGALTVHGAVQFNESLTVGTSSSNKNTTLNGNLTVTGTTTLKNATTAENTFTVGTSTSAQATILNGSLDVSGIASFGNTVFAPSFNGLLTGNVTGNLTGNVTGNVSGNAGTATKLAAAKKISLTGAVTGSGTFDGSGDLSIATSAAAVTWDSITNKPSYDDLYLKLSGGTMSGPITLKGSQYNYHSDANSYSLNCNNSDIIGANSIYFADACDGMNEGIHFYRSASTWDSISANNGTFYFASNHSATAGLTGNATIKAGAVYGAVWNDYAEYRNQKEIVEPGYCVASDNNGTIYKTIEKFQACDGIVSDTFGFAIGETEDCQTPLAVSGRVLAYCEGDRYDYQAGDTVCAGSNGKVVKMTRKEIQEWPDRIVGTVSEIPEYDTWGSGNVKVNGRIWIKVR